MAVGPHCFPNIYCLLRIACTVPVTLDDNEQANSTALKLWADHHDDGKTVWLGAMNIHYQRPVDYAGSGRVFSGSGIWPKYGAEFGKTQNILTGFGIWLLPGKRDSPKFGHGMRDFLACLSGIQESVTTQVNVLAAKANQSGERKISIKRANLYLKFISFCRN